MKLPDILNEVPHYIIGGVEYENNLAEDLAFQLEDPGLAFAEHAQRFAWYATAVEMAAHHEGVAKLHMESTLSQIQLGIRAGAIEVPGGKLTEKSIESHAKVQDSYIKAHLDYLEAKRQHALLKAAKDAMIHRREMLTNAGHTHRAEMRSDISINK